MEDIHKSFGQVLDVTSKLRNSRANGTLNGCARHFALDAGWEILI